MTSDIQSLEIKEIIGLANEVLKNPQKYNCLAGVSLGTKYYSQRLNVKLYINFLTKYFDKILFFINDYNYHWDLMAFQNLIKEHALKKAERMGKELRNSYQNIIDKSFPEDAERINITTFFELLENKEYRDFCQGFQKVLEENQKIKKEIEKDLDKQILYTMSIKKKIETIKKINPNFYQSAVRFCKNYVVYQLISNLYLMFELPIVYNIKVSFTPYSQFITLRKSLEGGYNNLKKKLNIISEWGIISGIVLEKIIK